MADAGEEVVRGGCGEVACGGGFEVFDEFGGFTDFAFFVDEGGDGFLADEVGLFFGFSEFADGPDEGADDGDEEEDEPAPRDGAFGVILVAPVFLEGFVVGGVGFDEGFDIRFLGTEVDVFFGGDGEALADLGGFVRIGGFGGRIEFDRFWGAVRGGVVQTEYGLRLFDFLVNRLEFHRLRVLWHSWREGKLEKLVDATPVCL